MGSRPSARNAMCSRAFRTSPLRAIRISLSLPSRSAKISAAPSSASAPASAMRTFTESSRLAARTILGRKSRRASAAATRSSLPSRTNSFVISLSKRLVLPQRIPLSPRSLFLGADGLDRSRKRVRPVQVPLLQDTHQAAGENIQRQAAGKRENHKHHGHADGHELHHLGLLGIRNRHGGHFGDEVHGNAHHYGQDVIRVL